MIGNMATAEVEVLELEKNKVEHDLHSAQNERTRVEETVKRLASRLTALNEELIKAKRKMGQEFIGTLQKIMVTTNDILQQPELRGDKDLREIVLDDLQKLLDQAQSYSQLLAGRVANPKPATQSVAVPEATRVIDVPGLPKDLSQYREHRYRSSMCTFLQQHAEAFKQLQAACGYNSARMAEALKARGFNESKVDSSLVDKLLYRVQYPSLWKKAA